MEDSRFEEAMGLKCKCSVGVDNDLYGPKSGTVCRALIKMAAVAHTALASPLICWLPLLKQTSPLVRHSLIGKDCLNRLLFLWKKIVPQVKAASITWGHAEDDFKSEVFPDRFGNHGFPRPAPQLT